MNVWLLQIEVFYDSLKLLYTRVVLFDQILKLADLLPSLIAFLFQDLDIVTKIVSL